MKTVLLTCDTYDSEGKCVRERFLIEINPSTGDAEIVNESHARIERDRSANFSSGVLAVEAA